MNCTDIRPLISAYHDGEATPEERKTVEKHLATCEACREILAEYRTIAGDLRTLSVPMPPAGLRRDVWRAIEARGGSISTVASSLPAVRDATPPQRRNGKVVNFPTQPQRNPSVVDVFTGSGKYARAVPALLLVAALVVALTFVLVRNLNPITAAAARLQEQQALADYGQTIHVLFNRNVRADLAEQYTIVEDISAGENVPASTGINNALVCNSIMCKYNYSSISGSNSATLAITPNTPWKPGARYRVTVDAPHIADSIGNVLANAPIQMEFTTFANTPTPSETATHTPSPTNTPVPPSPSMTPVPPKPTEQPTTIAVLPPSAPPATSVVPSTGTSGTPAVPASSNTPAPTPSNTLVPSSATSTVAVQPTHTVAPPRPSMTAPVPTNTPRIEPSSTLAPPSATPTAHNTPTQSATATPTAGKRGSPTPLMTATATPRATQTPGTGKGTPTVSPTSQCLILPVRGFGKLWTERPAVRDRIGCPTQSEGPITPAAQQHFENGYMFWRGDTHMIYVFVGDQNSGYGTWKEYKDTWIDGDPIPTPDQTPPAGTYMPVRGFGKLWASNESLRLQLGWATEPEISVDAVWQPYEHGYALWTADKLIRFLYEDGIWEKFNDTWQE